MIISQLTSIFNSDGWLGFRCLPPSQKGGKGVVYGTVSNGYHESKKIRKRSSVWRELELEQKMNKGNFDGGKKMNLF